MRKDALPRHQGHPESDVEAPSRFRDNLHALQVGLNLLRDEMLSGNLRGADLTYATIQHCLSRLSGDDVLALASSTASG